MVQVGADPLSRGVDGDRRDVDALAVLRGRGAIAHDGSHRLENSPAAPPQFHLACPTSMA
jgi:hypothetical protein